MKKTVLFTILILTLGLQSFSQAILNPNFILKSHETLDVMKMTRNADGISLQMLIKNARDEGGSFCVNKNTSIIANGLSYKIESFENIPECPEVHEFEFTGDNLIFYLNFPPIPPGIKTIDIVENCNENCFSIKGLIIDSKLNDEMNYAFDYYESGMLTEALSAYKDLLKKYAGKEPAVEGLFYFYIITILSDIGNEKEADKWLEEFRTKRLSESDWVLEKFK